jgi:hypothetical protein
MSKSDVIFVNCHNEDILAGSNSFDEFFNILDKLHPNNQHGVGELTVFRDVTPLYTYIRLLVFQSVRTKLNLKKHGYYFGYPLIN